MGRRNPLEGLNIMTSAINHYIQLRGRRPPSQSETTLRRQKQKLKLYKLAKQDTLISGSTIKTVAGKSVVGSGNVAITKEGVGLPNVDNTSDIRQASVSCSRPQS